MKDTKQMHIFSNWKWHTSTVLSQLLQSSLQARIFHPAFCRSSSTACFHMVFGLPLFFFFPLLPKLLLCCSCCLGPISEGVQSSSISAALIHCSAASSQLLLGVLRYRHDILNILCRHIWCNTSTILLSFLFIFHVSHPYRNTGLTSVLYRHSYVLLKMLLEVQVCINLMKALLTLASLSYCLLLYKLWLLIKWTHLHLQSLAHWSWTL